MFVVGVFGYELLEKSFDVPARGWRRIFHRSQTTTGVLHKNRRNSIPCAGLVDLVLNRVGDFVGAFAFGANLEVLVLHAHRVQGAAVS